MNRNVAVILFVCVAATLGPGPPPLTSARAAATPAANRTKAAVEQPPRRRLSEDVYVWASQTETLLAPDGAAGDGFGWPVAISETNLVVGAPWDDDAGSGSGSAIVHRTTDDGATWDFVQKLIAPSGAAQYFGFSVALHARTLVVGAYGYDDGGTYDKGAAFVYKTADDGISWTFVQKLEAPDGVAFDYFGFSCAISENFIIVGAPQSNCDSLPGAAYIFRTTNDGATWNFVQKSRRVGRRCG